MLWRGFNICSNNYIIDLRSYVYREDLTVQEEDTTNNSMVLINILFNVSVLFVIGKTTNFILDGSVNIAKDYIMSTGKGLSVMFNNTWKIYTAVKKLRTFILHKLGLKNCIIEVNK